MFLYKNLQIIFYGLGFVNSGHTNYIFMIRFVNYGCRKTDGYVEMIIWYLACSIGVSICFDEALSSFNYGEVVKYGYKIQHYSSLLQLRYVQFRGS